MAARGSVRLQDQLFLGHIDVSWPKRLNHVELHEVDQPVEPVLGQDALKLRGLRRSSWTTAPRGRSGRPCACSPRAHGLILRANGRGGTGRPPSRSPCAWNLTGRRCRGLRSVVRSRREQMRTRSRTDYPRSGKPRWFCANFRCVPEAPRPFPPHQPQRHRF